MEKPPPVLVVEDDPALRQAVCEVLADICCEPIGAADGKEALAQLRNGLRPRLILLDLVMPVMDGWRFREAQASDPALSDIPVILLSSETNARVRPIDVPMILRKPVPLAELTRTVQRFCAA